jgi:hypothetical protein
MPIGNILFGRRRISGCRMAVPVCDAHDVPLLSWTMALVAALFFAVSATIQQGAARAAAAYAQPPTSDRRLWLPVLGLLGRLARDRLWLFGWLLNVAGFIAHAAALHFGSITVVQAILVVQIIMAVGVAAIVRRERPRSRDWLGAVTVATGVILVVAIRGQVVQVAPPRVEVARAMAVSATTILTILVLARGVVRRELRSALTAIGAGISFCTTAILIVVVTGDLSRHGPIGVVSWPAPALALSAVIGSLLVQDSFAGGSLPVALTAMTVTDPVSSAFAGLVLFDAALPTGAAIIGLVLAAILIAVGVTVVANSGVVRRAESPTVGPSDTVMADPASELADQGP